MRKSFAVVILGGLAILPGAIAAAYPLGVIEACSVFYRSAGWQTVLTPLLIVLVLIFRPQSLLTLQEERLGAGRSRTLLKAG